MAGPPRVVRRVVDATRDLADDWRVRRPRRVAEARADAIVPELPRRDEIEVVSSVIARRPDHTVALVSSDAIRVREPSSQTARVRLPACKQVGTVRQPGC